MSTLIFKLPQALPTSASALQVVQQVDAGTPAHLQDALLAILPDTPGAERVALVPVQRLSWHRVELPTGTLDKGFFNEGGSPRLRAVLEGLLEERLLDDTALLHFAIAPQANTGAPSWVAVCDKAWLKAWLAALEQAGRTITRVVPEFTPPDGDTAGLQLTAVGSAGAPQLICAGLAGVSALPLNATTLQWLLLPLADTDTNAPPLAPRWLAEPSVAAAAEQLAAGSITLQTEAERAMLAVQSGWDLAQFEFSASRQARSRKRWSSLWSRLLQAPEWRAVRWSAVALLVVQIVGLQAWSWKEQSAQTAKRNAIAAVLTGTFPETKVVVDAPVQMARSVAALQRQSGAATGADLETILNRFGAMVQVNAAPSAIEFIANEVRIVGLDSNAAEFAGIAANLQAQGYTARWDGGTLVIAPARTGAAL
jgi:general secretion pathway protein L